MRTHDQIDRRSLALACLVADKLERQPELLDLARHNLERWMAQTEGAPLRAHTEWRELLDRLSPSALLEMLRSDTEEARRLRQSSPFAGLLSPQERWRILREYETQPA